MKNSYRMSWRRNSGSNLTNNLKTHEGARKIIGLRHTSFISAFYVLRHKKLWECVTRTNSINWNLLNVFFHWKFFQELFIWIDQSPMGRWLLWIRHETHLVVKQRRLLLFLCKNQQLQYFVFNFAIFICNHMDVLRFSIRNILFVPMIHFL